MSNTVRYAAMKDSGIKWIGDIPETWTTRTLYQLATRVSNKNTDLAEQNLLSLSYGKIKRKDINSNDGLLPATFDGYNIIEAGDIVLRLTDLQNDHTSLRVGQATERGIITSAYVTLRSINPAYSRYLYYLIHVFDLKKGFYGMGSGVRQGLNYDEVKNIRIVLPPQKEQYAITEYLDNQCSQIDTLVQEAMDSILEYKKWRTAIISEVVIKGLDTPTKMRDSKIEWIGNIPVGWKITRMKNILSNITIKNRSEATVLSLYRDYGVIPKDSRDDNHNVTSENTSQYKFVAVGNLVINKMKAWQGSLGVSKYEGIVSPAYYVCEFISNKIEKRYLHHLLRCKLYAQEFEKLSTGMRIGQWNLGIDDFMNVPALIPSIDEQKKIASYLDERCTWIDELIQKKLELISTLGNYKQALIYEVVLGRRKVV